MKKSDFYYNLPQEFIAQTPVEPRNSSRLMILDKENDFSEIFSPKRFDLSASIKNIVFNLGMVEAISYFKATCSPQMVIKCGKLDSYQEAWFRKLYYLWIK